MVLLARNEVPAVTDTTFSEGPLLPVAGSPVAESVDTTLAPLVMVPALVMMRPVTVITGAVAPAARFGPE